MMNRQLFRALSLATRNVPSVPRLFPCQHTIQCHRNIVSQRLCLPNSVHLNLMHANTPKHKLKFFITRENNLVSLTCTVRWMSENKKSDQSQDSTFRRNPGTGENDYSFLLYGLAISITFLGLSYLAVPLYRMFCQAVGLGGTAYRSHDTEKVKNMEMVNREIVVTFNADKSAKLKWNFRPQQHHVKVKLGETALAFYTAENPTDKPVIGISSYSIDPPPAGPYFNKIQCFCFEEQMLKPHEKVDLPVFFYIDPDYDDDIMLENINEIGLSYTFFPAKRGVNLPGYQMNTLQYGVKLKPQEEKQTT